MLMGRCSFFLFFCRERMQYCSAFFHGQLVSVWSCVYCFWIILFILVTTYTNFCCVQKQIHYYGCHLIFLCEIFSNGYADADIEFVLNLNKVAYQEHRAPIIGCYFQFQIVKQRFLLAKSSRFVSNRMSRWILYNCVITIYIHFISFIRHIRTSLIKEFDMWWLILRLLSLYRDLCRGTHHK